MAGPMAAIPHHGYGDYGANAGNLFSAIAVR